MLSRCWLICCVMVLMLVLRRVVVLLCCRLRLMLRLVRFCCVLVMMGLVLVMRCWCGCLSFFLLLSVVVMGWVWVC